MSNTLQLLQRARHLAKNYRHEEAERLVLQALSAAPDDADATADLGILYCWTQREVEAVDLLSRAEGGERYDELARFLTDHLHCRKAMAAKLGIDDPKGRRLLETVRARTNLEPGDVGIGVSACLIVKNEEAHLDRCLASVKDLVDEIVVVDTGSTDGTMAIAERYGAKIGHFEWTDDFSAARNESLRLATGHWALWIDADEELEAVSAQSFREALMRPQFGGFYIRILNLLDEEGDSNQYVHVPIRLFQRREGIHFEGRVHEQVSPSLGALGLPNATLESARIRHYGYRPSEMASKDKLNRTVSLIERELEERPHDGFQWFNLANAQIVAREFTKAALSARSCLEHLEPGASYGPQAYQILASALVEQGCFEEALEACAEADKAGHGSILTEFEKAHSLQRMHRNEEALAAIERCLAMEWPHDLTGDFGIATHKRHLLKGQILAQMGSFDEAIRLFDFALEKDPASSVARFSKATTLAAMDRPEEALAEFEAGFGDPQLAGANRKGAAKVHQARGDLAQACALFEEAWRLRPQDQGFWVQWVQCAEALGNVEAVVRAYEELSKQQPLSADMLVNWGRALDASGEPERALQCLTEALKRDSTNANAYFNCGDLLYRMGHFQDAAHLYESGLRHQPMNADGWFVLGNSLAQLGILGGAATAYRQALNVNPRHSGAQGNLEIVSQTAA